MGAGNSLAKLSSDFFYETGLLHKWTADEMMGAVKSGIDAPSQLLTDAWDDNPNTFRHLGENVGSIGQSAGMFGVNAWFAGHSWRRFEGQKGHMYTAPSGRQSFFAEGPGGKLLKHNSNPLLGGAKSAVGVTELELLEALTKKGLGTLKGGVFQRGLKAPRGGIGGTGFIGELGMAKNLAAMMIPMVGLTLARSALGITGSFIDSALQDYRRSRVHHYDQRYFNTEEANMSSFAQIGAGMRQQEMRMMNVSRIMHSRG